MNLFSRRSAFACILLGVCVAPLSAQAPEYQGLSAGFFFGGAQWRLDDGLSPTHFAGGLTAGYRFHLFDVGTSAVSLTPHFALTVTQFRGISLNSNEIGFSRIDKLANYIPALQLAVRTGPVRPYVLFQPGDVTIERYVNGNLMNYWGSARSYGIGVEIPRNNVCGAGFNIAARRMVGSLTNVEWRGVGTPPPGGSIGATIVTVGWSGRFRGTRLLFACS